MATQDIPRPLTNADLQLDNVSLLLKTIITDHRNGASKIKLPLRDLIPDFAGRRGAGLGEVARIASVLTKTRFECIDNPDGTVTFTAVAPMPATAAEDAAPTKKDGEKVKRPKNAFVIYRLRHHQEVRDQNPGLHNNGISKIIGQMWANEPQSVKDEYKQLAEDEKRQHAIDHPGYQYQPRKPSEKKKRMTKNKLAKIAARSGNIGATTDATNLPAQQGEQITVDTLMPPYQNNTPQITTLPGGVPAAAFNVVPGAAGDDGLRDQLDLFNSQVPQLQAAADLCAPPAAFGSMPLLQGEGAYKSLSADGLSTYDVVPFGTEWPSEPVEEARTFDPYAEQHRQEQLDDEFSLYFNYDAAASAVPADFDPTGMFARSS